ncbi:MAG: hypothetical protein FJ211_10745, partial [Ignavibacteria bacterium]|nr:hypothetical protein [Ignavibacteria bacterium]
MGVPGSANALLLASTAAGGYTISRSLRFNSSDSAYLSRTPASAGNRKTWTWSGWVKRAKLSTNQSFLAADPPGSAYSYFRFTSSDTLDIYSRDAGGSQLILTTSQVFRDPNGWFHVVLASDTTQGSDSNRFKVYVNGQQVTQFSSATYPGPNADLAFNGAFLHSIGDLAQSTQYFDGYLADIWFLDGLTPTTAVVNGVTQLTQLGEFDTNGIWQPKAWDGAALTGNSFHLDFADNSSLTSGSNTGIGKDTSGNGHYWNTYGLSVTAGAGNDSLIDSPTNYGTDTGVGGEVRGNYCTWNPLGAGTNIGVSNGNLDATSNTNDWRQIKGTIGVTSGKWYWECTNTGTSGTFNQYHGISNDLESPATNLGTVSGYCYGHGGDKYAAGTNTGGAGATYTNGDVIGMALDLDSGTQTIKFYKNGSLQFTQTISGNGPWYPASNCYYSQTGPIFVTNFGQRPFAFPVSGFKALCTANLPTPTIAKGSDYFDVKLYTGTAATQSITGLGFSPDWVWIKNRNGSAAHHVFDTVRGVAKRLITNGTQDDTYNASDSLTSFNSTGFTLGADTSTGCVNYPSSATYAAWCWDAGANSSKTYTVTVVSGEFYIDGKQKPTLNLEEGSTYTFDLSAASNSGHPFLLSTNSDNNPPAPYTTGVTTNGTA